MSDNPSEKELQAKARVNAATITAGIGLLGIIITAVCGLVGTYISKGQETNASKIAVGFQAIVHLVTAGKLDVPEITSKSTIGRTLPESDSHTARDNKPETVQSGMIQPTRISSLRSCSTGLKDALIVESATARVNATNYVVKLILHNIAQHPLTLSSLSPNQLTDDVKNGLTFLNTSMPVRTHWELDDITVKSLYASGQRIDPDNSGAIIYTFAGISKPAESVSLNTNVVYAQEKNDAKIVAGQITISCDDIPVK
jgi:hypothetical protein